MTGTSKSTQAQGARNSRIQTNTRTYRKRHVSHRQTDLLTEKCTDTDRNTSADIETETHTQDTQKDKYTDMHIPTKN